MNVNVTHGHSSLCLMRMLLFPPPPPPEYLLYIFLFSPQYLVYLLKLSWDVRSQGSKSEGKGEGAREGNKPHVM